MNDCTVLFEAQGWGRARRVWDVPKWTIPWTCWLPQVFMKMMLIKMVYFNKSLSSESWYILYILQLRPYSGIWAKIWLIPSARALQRNNIKHPPPKNLNNFKNVPGHDRSINTSESKVKFDLKEHNIDDIGHTWRPMKIDSSGDIISSRSMLLDLNGKMINLTSRSDSWTPNSGPILKERDK